MTSMTDILYGIGDALGDTYAIYGEPPLQVDENVERYVVVTITPVTEVTEGTQFTVRSVLVDIANAGDPDIKQVEYHSFVDDCNRALRPVFDFGAHHIMPERISSNITDGIAHYMFYLEFTDAFDITTPAAPYMAELKNRRK